MRKKTSTKLLLTTLAVSIIMSQLPVSAIAARREPPPEAFTVCVGKSEGAAVSITTPRNETLNATCRMFNGKLAAAPETPPEAFEACAGKSEGTPVTITTPENETISAICRMFNGKLAAAPDKGRPGQK